MNHIQSIVIEENSYCGESLGIEFYFKSLDQAVLAGIFNETKIPCKKCIHECMSILSKHQEESK